MKHNNNSYVAIATIKFKSPKGYRPSILTFRKCFICVKRNDPVVEKEASNTAEDWKRKLAEANHGIELSYSIKIETISVAGVDIIGPNGIITG